MKAKKTAKVAKPKESKPEGQIVCPCGSVNFHAFTGGALECAKCGAKQ